MTGAAAKAALGRVRGREGALGAATLELALAIPVLVIVLVAALGGIACLTTQLRCNDAALQSARLAARGDLDAASEAARRVLAGAAVTIDRDSEVVTVRVQAAPLSLFPGLTISAQAVVPREPNP